jgi:ketosteroid isomerase-like protein
MTDEGQAVAQLYALNVFHKTPHGWRLVAHHTSPGHLADVGGVGDSGEPSSVLH